MECIRKIFAAALILCSLLFIPASAMAGNMQPVAADVLTSLAQEKMDGLLAASGEKRRCQVELIDAPKRDIWVPAGVLSYDTEAPQGLQYQQLTPIYVVIYVDGNAVCRTSCHYKMHVYDKMVVAAQNIMAEAKISAVDVRLEEREISGPQLHYFNQLHEVLGNVLTSGLPAGKVLRQEMLQTPRAIRSHALVSIIVRSGDIEVHADGAAMQNGRIGQMIRVRNLASGRILNAKVIDGNTVEVLS
jgi:flagella basal body P-ring formation protein FlgA